MPEQHSFEYAVIRVVPKVEREEFMNVGVILYCQSLVLSGCIILPWMKKDCAPFHRIWKWTEIKKHLPAFCEICKGGPACRSDRKAGYGIPFSVAHGNAQYCAAMFQSTSRT